MQRQPETRLLPGLRLFESIKGSSNILNPAASPSRQYAKKPSPRYLSIMPLCVSMISLQVEIQPPMSSAGLSLVRLRLSGVEFFDICHQQPAWDIFDVADCVFDKRCSNVISEFFWLPKREDAVSDSDLIVIGQPERVMNPALV